MKTGMFVALIIISSMVSSVYAGSSFSGTTGTNVPGTKGFTLGTSSIIAGNYDVNGSTTTTTTKKGRDGAACSSNDECSSDVCEGGSCCTDYGDPCDSSSHCCGHQSCTKEGTCPE